MKKVRADTPFQSLILWSSAVFLILFVILPLGSLFIEAFHNSKDEFVGFKNFIDYFTTPNLMTSLSNTLYVSTVTTVITVILAFGYAYGLTRTYIYGKQFLKFSGMLPLFAPTMMLGISLIYLFGNKGLLTMLGVKVALYGQFGIIVSEVIYAFPQAFMILLIALTYGDQRLYEVADVMGTSSIKKFMTITLPGVKYGLISASFVAFTMSFTDFGAPKVVGGNYNVLATDIYKQVVGQQNFSMGSVVGILLMIPAVLSFVVDRLLKSKHGETINAKTVALKIKFNPVRDILFNIYCYVICFVIYGLLGTVLFAATANIWPYDLTFTLKYFFFDSPSTGGISSYYNSLLVATITACVGTIVVFLIAYVIEKMRKLPKVRQGVYFLSILPLALPGLVIGISYVFYFINPNNPFNFLYGSIWILVIANIIHFYSVPFITATTSLRKLDKEFELVSESMRIPFLQFFQKVTLPMSVPALLEIFFYFFVNSMVTISAVVFLYAAEFKLAAIAIVNMEDAGDIASAAALSVLIIGTNILVRGLYEGLNYWIQKNQKVGKRLDE